MSSKLSTSRLGSFFGIGNKHSTKRTAAQREPVGDFRDAQENTSPTDYRALHDALYLNISHDASGRGLPAQNARTVPEPRHPISQKEHYPQSLYALPDADPFAASSPITLPVSNARSPADYYTVHPPPKIRPLLIQTQSDTSVPVPSPFGSPIDHDQNASR